MQCVLKSTNPVLKYIDVLHAVPSEVKSLPGPSLGVSIDLIQVSL